MVMISLRRKLKTRMIALDSALQLRALTSGVTTHLERIVGSKLQGQYDLSVRLEYLEIVNVELMAKSTFTIYQMVSMGKIHPKIAKLPMLSPILSIQADSFIKSIDLTVKFTS